MLILHYIPVEYGRQDPAWQKYLNKICETAKLLQDKNTRFKGKTVEEFEDYCKYVSKIMEPGLDAGMQGYFTTLPDWELVIKREENLAPFINECLKKGIYTGFYYETDESQAMLMDDLMRELSKRKFERWAYDYEISEHLSLTGYHEEIHHAMRNLFELTEYAVQSNSTRRRICNIYETQTITSTLTVINYRIQDIRNLI